MTAWSRGRPGPGQGRLVAILVTMLMIMLEGPSRAQEETRPGSAVASVVPRLDAPPDRRGGVPEAAAHGTPRDSSLVPVTVDPAGERPSRAPIAIATYHVSRADGFVLLRGDASSGSDLTYRWIQTRGPTVALEDPERPVVRFGIPESPEPLEFLLLVGNGHGVDADRVTVTIAEAVDPGLRLRADAGDDQFSAVGRQVTLNGSRSEPRNDVGYRWIQVGGPAVDLRIEDRYIYTFIPMEPGVYRFALVIASDSAISRPDLVDITVLPEEPAIVRESQPTLATDDLARQSLVRASGGVAAALLLAETFEEIAGRIDLYATYSELTAEMSRRLDEIVPREPERRATWNEHVFHPLTVRLIERLRPTGVDLVTPGATETPLSPAQRGILAGELRAMAAGFRASRPGR